MGVASIVAVVVWLGMGVAVAVIVIVGDGIGDDVAVTDCPHAISSKPITRKIITLKRLFMLTYFFVVSTI